MASSPRHRRLIDGADVLRASLDGVGDGLGRIVGVFADVVGPDVARVATPTSLRRGTLTIRCASAAWAQTLGGMELELIERLAPRLGRGTVRRINARAGGTALPPPPPEPAALAPLDEQTARTLDDLAAPISDPALRARVLAAMRAMERRRASGANP